MRPRALVTGATHGRGRASALALAGSGVSVVACHGTDDEAAYSLARELKEIGDGHTLVHADVTRPGGAAASVEACGSSLAIVVTCAEPRDDDWASTVDSVLTAPALVSRAAAPRLRAGAALVHIGSRPGTGTEAAAAAEAGLVGLTRALARQLGPTGVRVNHIAAGSRVTDEQVAAVAVFLAGDLAAGVTGESVVVDGAE